jgi:NAD(P)-dependent dehydrogenase (short-subunit alcohol dehydrogenase family)
MQRIALVTGANRGIGLEVARQLVYAGLQVILTSREAAAGARAAEALRAAGRDIVTAVLDVTDPAQVEAVRAMVEQRFGRLDVLVNNAAVYLDEGVSVFDVALETVRRTLEVNFFGPLLLSRTFAPLMIRNGYGRIVNVSSGAGQLHDMDGGTAGYKVSKAALNALTRILADELSGHDIKVNSVCPGWVRTRMGGPAAPRGPEQAAAGIVWLALLPADGPSGGFFRDRKPIPW